MIEVTSIEPVKPQGLICRGLEGTGHAFPNRAYSSARFHIHTHTDAYESH
jgi:hypothetical protein